MASGLVALLDDIAALAKLTAATVDDVAYGAAKASAKSAGVIIDDTAVTPQYVRGISPKRELGVIFKIAKGSFFNKFVLIIPIAMILTEFAPWLLPYLLICGGLYLAFEGGEKIYEWLSKSKHSVEASAASGKEAEGQIIKSATRTDLILSTEIMLISLSNIDADVWWMRLLILAVVAIAMTLIVYGAVGMLIKIDDLGLWFTKTKNKILNKFGHGLVNSMPMVFQIIGVVGTVAMLWVGGHILITNLAEIGAPFINNFLHYIVHFIEHFGGFAVWFVDTLVSAIVGLIVGLACFFVFELLMKMKENFSKNKKKVSNEQ